MKNSPTTVVYVQRELQAPIFCESIQHVVIPQHLFALEGVQLVIFTSFSTHKERIKELMHGCMVANIVVAFSPVHARMILL